MKILYRINAEFSAIIAGYEPVRVRAFVGAVLVLLASFGIGSGGFPPQVDAVLAFLAFVVPILAGELARRKVTPVGPSDDHEALLPDDPYGD